MFRSTGNQIAQAVLDPNKHQRYQFEMRSPQSQVIATMKMMRVQKIDGRFEFE
jgi:hypothetical protein